ncbi:hypothetical protein TVAG_129930 [Trichomonas vaginalis G3]|uniref:Uncharacterized protein n=1 Tax=Trichomonas vaginalis (strain ATCC PRA-98 / G3) TaxID=412133 RepID=A2DI89_TRIV3|nr:hypothetical protein TVAGG3_0712220 [Trichomonas vaginalis G3]EAY19885.1 hypothetical protein TVAG_129930 [Trichomonas vaginalis G3]KAI5509988.1 hypothetical protein TVAGG3_0712220 [Trichomonas vaginalis G3]|eukprot:XP_001580871.1 hypothetical protein [Trichomonas vaginalis G3]
MDLSLVNRFNDVLESQDVDTLRAALQNLMVLFETQNRNYLELKQQVKNLKIKKPNMVVEQCEEISIDPEDNRPPSNDIIDDSYELLASIRRSRKVHNRTIAGVEKMLNTLCTNEENRTNQMASILNSE